MGEVDAMTIRYNAQLAARNQLTQAANFGAQAGLYSAQAGYDTSAGYLGIGSSLLGGASSISNKWLQYSQSGIPGFGFTTNQPEGIMG
jgi:hypothetical protein